MFSMLMKESFHQKGNVQMFENGTKYYPVSLTSPIMDPVLFTINYYFINDLLEWFTIIAHYMSAVKKTIIII